MTADRAGRPDVALLRFDKSIEIMEEALGKGYLLARAQVVGARINRAGALAARGDHARAALDVQALPLQPGLRSVSLYNIACVLSLSGAAAEQDSKLPAAERTRLKTLYCDRAMDFLHDAVARGYNHPVAIKADTDLEALRARDDFRKLIVDLEAQQKTSGGGETDR